MAWRSLIPLADLLSRGLDLNYRDFIGICCQLDNKFYYVVHLENEVPTCLRPLSGEPDHHNAVGEVTDHYCLDVDVAEVLLHLEAVCIQ